MKFDIQKFADTVTASSEVKFNFAFDDGDTRVITLKNPNTTYCTAENAQALSDWVIANQPIVGDKSGTSSSTGLIEAYILDKTTQKLDLTP